MKHEPKVQTPIAINWSQVITSVVITSVVTAVATAMALLRLSDTNTVVIAGQAKAIEELKSGTVPRGEYEQVIIRIDGNIDSINRSIIDLNRNFNTLLERVQ